MSLVDTGLNLPLRIKSAITTSEISPGSAPCPFHLKGTTPMGRALFIPSVMTISKVANTLALNTIAMAAIHKPRIFISLQFHF